MGLINRPLWGMELFIGGLALCGVLALASAGWRERETSQRFAPTRPWIHLCSDIRSHDREVLHPFERVERLLREGQFEAATRLWTDMRAGVACALRLPPRPGFESQDHQLALELIQRSARWVRAYPAWGAELANRAGRWQPREAVLNAWFQGDSPDRHALWRQVLQPQHTLLQDAQELDSVQAAFADWLRALRLPSAERFAFLARQPGAQRWVLEPTRLVVYSRRPAQLMEPGAPEVLTLELPF